MQIMTIRSGSSANCILIKQYGYGVLIDAGIGIRTLSCALKAVDFDIDRIAAIFITHEHSDHVKGLETILKYKKIPVFGNKATLDAVWRKYDIKTAELTDMPTGSSAACPDLKITSFRTPHDSVESVGYTVTDGVKKFSLATDIGIMTKEVATAIVGSDAVVLESNYDEYMLKNGVYPPILKERILSKTGHLSNDDCAKFAPLLVERGTKRIILGHLSQNNNTPDLAYRTTADALENNGMIIGRDVSLSAASRTEASPLFEV